MARAVTSLKKLMELGERYRVAVDEDYVAAAKTYAEEVALIASMRAQLKADGMTVSKEYVKGRGNVCVHPLVPEIPKHIDCANRTLAILANIIDKRGNAAEVEADPLDEFKL